MNCPSRTDDALLHPGWNQNPPLFAADLTTREDMNGIVNVRELGDADLFKAGLQSPGLCELEGSCSQDMDNERQVAGMGARCPHEGPCTHSVKNDTSFSEYQVGRLPPRYSPSVGTGAGWLTWILSVLCASILLSSIMVTGFLNMSDVTKLFLRQPHVSPDLSTRPVKRSACATGGAGPDYNLPLHVGALFIILFVSSTGCAFPLLVLKFPRLRIPASFLFSARHFGTGVLIATAFVHLLPTAFISLGDPCLSKFWTTDYPAMPGAIALAAIFSVTVIEMVFSPGRHCSGNNASMNAVSRTERAMEDANVPTPRPAMIGSDDAPRGRSPPPAENMRVRDLGQIHGRVTSISRTLSRMGEESEILDAAEFGNGRQAHHDRKDADVESADSERTVPSAGFTPEQMHKKAVMQCFLLEMGILFHSVFIGMSLSVSVGSDFVVLVIAIIFHQTFEGLALGARIGAIAWPEKSLQPWLMALAYGCTTPLGQAIGIATHTLYSPDSEIGLLIVGIMNAISSGLLVFASLVELMSEDFLSDESWTVLRGKKRVYACALVFMGAFLMSLVGAWA